jgi:hypothetical protein
MQNPSPLLYPKADSWGSAITGDYNQRIMSDNCHDGAQPFLTPIQVLAVLTLQNSHCRMPCLTDS